MTIWIAIFLFLHVMGAIIAFGPGYSAPIIGRLTGQEPQHANFAARINDAITDQRVVPLAIFQGVTGLVLIWLTGINPLTTLWLGVGIAVYLVALGYALFFQRPTIKRIVALTSSPPPPGAAGPPPELMAAVKRAQQGGAFLGLLIVLIVILMVTKPTL
jgi:heme O synthase-like polyprenyltransferase